jgi:hypothetical protein
MLALLRTGGEGASRLSVPLHAQSPLPWMVDLVDPARDFRQGMMRHHAAFVWTLIRPSADFKSDCIFVIKADRNGVRSATRSPQSGFGGVALRLVLSLASTNRSINAGARVGYRRRASSSSCSFGV